MRYLALLLLFPAFAIAGDVIVSWVPPTDPVESYNIVMTKDGEQLTPIVVPGDQQNHEIQGIGPGKYTLYMTSNIGDEQSGPSNVVSFLIEKEPENPEPPSITIQFNGFGAEGFQVK